MDPLSNPNEMTHVECALSLLAAGERDCFDTANLLAAAQVHATLALVEAIENWQPPAPADDASEQGVPREEFADRWG